MLNEYISNHLPRATFNYKNNYKNDDNTSDQDVKKYPFMKNMVISVNHGVDYSRPEVILTDFVNSLIHDQLYDPSERRHADKKSTSGDNQESKRRHNNILMSTSNVKNKYIRNFLPPPVMLRYQYDTIIERRGCYDDDTAPGDIKFLMCFLMFVICITHNVYLDLVPPLVLVFPKAEKMDRFTLSGIVDQLQETFSSTSCDDQVYPVKVILLLLQSSCCPLPFPLIGGNPSHSLKFTQDFRIFFFFLLLLQVLKKCLMSHCSHQRLPHFFLMHSCHQYCLLCIFYHSLYHYHLFISYLITSENLMVVFGQVL